MSYLYIFFTVFLFSTLEVTGKLIGADFSPVAITAFRFLLGGIFFLPLAILQIRKERLRLKLKDVALMGALGVLNVVIAMLCLQYAIYYGEASVSAILISVNPIFVAFFAYLILQENMKLSKILGLLFGLLGVFLIIRSESQTPSAAINPLFGVVFGLIASVTFGLFTVLAKKYSLRYGVMVMNCVSFFVGSFVLILLALCFGVNLTFDPTIQNISFIAYLGFFVSGIAYLAYFEGLKKVPTGIGAMFFFLKPILASVLAFIFFKEQLTVWQYVGIAIVFWGIFSDTLLPRLRQKKNEDL